MTRLRTLVADDEAPARNYLLRLLTRAPDVEVVGEASHGREALRALETLRPDVAFLDIRMPGLDGFEVLRLLDPAHLPPVVVFVTAYDAHALKAFEAQALDYLLKPFDDERFDRCLGRIRSHWNGAGMSLRSVGLDAALPFLRTSAPADHITVRQRGRILVLPVEDVDWVAAEDNYVRVHARGASHLLRESLGSLEARLDPGRFVRIHRSTLVNLARIASLEPLEHGEFRVHLSTGSQVVLSRRHRADLERRLGKL